MNIQMSLSLTLAKRQPKKYQTLFSENQQKYSNEMELYLCSLFISTSFSDYTYIFCSIEKSLWLAYYLYYVETEKWKGIKYNSKYQTVCKFSKIKKEKYNCSEKFKLFGTLGTILWIPNFLFPQVEIVLYNLLRNSTIEIKSNNGLEWNKNEGAQKKR